jgi:YidC/Oxa1 family membrane protein insertase
MDRRTIIFVVLMTTTFFVINHFLFPPKPSVNQNIVTTTEKSLAPPTQPPSQDETLYVIENGYQQLVVSSINGAIAEINLPLHSQDDPQSVVRKIEVDEVLQKKYPQNDYFPATAYQTYQGSFNKGELGGYYPLLRRDVAPAYYGLATTASNLESAKTTYRLNRLEKNLIELEGTTAGVRLRKIYQFPEDASLTPYSFELTIIAEQNPADLGITTGIPEVEIVSGSSSSSLKYRAKDSRQKEFIEQISLPKGGMTTLTTAHPEWISNSNGFFAVLIDPQTEMGTGFSASQIPGNSAPTRLSVIDEVNPRYPAANYPGYDLKIPFNNHEGTYKFRVFAGPLDSSVLEENDKIFKANYSGMQSFHGWFSFISEPFAKFLFFLMKIFYATVHSWGISIILLTIALRLMMYPLNAWSIRSTMKMQKLSPKLAALQERYKKDPKKAQMEIMGLYKEHGVNPLGGCFPLLIQMPFLIGMFDLLKSTFELRGVSFIPGWITNLTAPDALFSWSTPIWLIGNSFHLLPILLGAVMFWQQRMSSFTPRNPKAMTDQQKQQKMMGNIMVIVFTVLFYNFPSGLNVYWLSSMLLAILQQWWMTKKRIKV